MVITTQPFIRSIYQLHLFLFPKRSVGGDSRAHAPGASFDSACGWGAETPA